MKFADQQNILTMKYHKVSIYFILIIIFSSCSANKQEGISESNSFKKFDITEIDSLYKLSNEKILEIKSYIVLETNEDCIIGSFDKLIVKNDKFYVMDRKRSHKIFVFSNSGQFISSISGEGGGPGEYSFLQDFDVDDQGNIHILDSRAPKVIVLDSHGQLLKENRFNFFPESFSLIKDETYLFNSRDRGDEDSGLNYNLIFWSFSDGIIKTEFKNREILDSPSFIRFSLSSLSKTENEPVLFHQAFSNDFYSVENDELKLAYRFDFGEKNMNLELLDQRKNGIENTELLTASGEGGQFFRYFDSNHYFTTMFIINNQPHYFVYDKLKDKYWIRKHWYMSKELPFGYWPYACDGTDLYGIISTDNIQLIKSDNFSEDDQLLIEQSGLEFIKSLEDYSNPVIVKYSYTFID